MIKLKIVLKKEVIMFSTLKNKIVDLLHKSNQKNPYRAGATNNQNLLMGETFV